MQIKCIRLYRTKAQLTAQEQIARAELEELRAQLATAQTQLAERSRVLAEATSELNALRSAQTELELKLSEARFPLVFTLVSWVGWHMTVPTAYEYHHCSSSVPSNCFLLVRVLQIHSLKIELKERSEAVNRLQQGLNNEKVPNGLRV